MYGVHGADQLETHSSRCRNMSMSFMFAHSETETSHREIRESKMKQASRGSVIHIHAGLKKCSGACTIQLLHALTISYNNLKMLDLTSLIPLHSSG